MTLSVRRLIAFGCALVLFPVILPLSGIAQTSICRIRHRRRLDSTARGAIRGDQASRHTRARAATHRAAAVTPLAPAPGPVAAPPPPRGLVADVSLADIGFANGLRFSLGGRSDVFVPVPEGDGLAVSDLVLVIDHVSAHDARRNLEVQVNDRTASAIALDGNSRGREISIPLRNVAPKNGYLKLSFLYSGAATLDRCIDVRSVGGHFDDHPRPQSTSPSIGPARLGSPRPLPDAA